jgi:Flp pilus assembly secretin CpaC
MKTYTPLILAVLLPSLLYSADSVADPFAFPHSRSSAKHSPEAMIEVTAEWLQVSEADATALLHDDKPPANSLEWRQKLNSLLKDGKARVAASASAVTQEGQTGKSISERESNYITGQTEFERTEPSDNDGMGSEHPVTRIKTESEYEMAAHGISLEVEPSIKESDLIHLNLSLEWATLVRAGSDRREPEAVRNSHESSFLVRAGGSLLIGVSTPRGDEGELDSSQRLLCFVSVRLVKP